MGKLDAIKQGMSLLTYKVPKGKINPKNMGYVLSDGTINFGSEEAAISYTKNRIMSALKAKEPFERGVYVNKNRILEETDGTTNSVKMGLEEAMPEHTMFFHGHSKAQPISVSDYFCLKSYPNLDSVHAYDTSGEISSLYKTRKNTTKLDNQSINDLLWQSNEFIGYQYQESICAPFKKEFKKLLKIPDKTERDAVCNNLYSKIQSSPEGQLRIHRFWQQNAKKLGVRYETNYTGFPPKEVSLTERIINTFKNLFSKSE